MTFPVSGWYLKATLIVLLALAMIALLSVSTFAQAPGVGYSRPEAESSRTPFKIKMSGFINTQPEDENSAIKFSIGIYRETYQFEITSIEAVDRERTTARAIIDPTEHREVAFDMTGPKNLLSKIAQAQPGTPLAITGFLQQRERKIQVTEVEVIGFETAEDAGTRE
jgi:hypothetical protein